MSFFLLCGTSALFFPIDKQVWLSPLFSRQAAQSLIRDEFQAASGESARLPCRSFPGDHWPCFLERGRTLPLSRNDGDIPLSSTPPFSLPQDEPVAGRSLHWLPPLDLSHLYAQK